MQGLQSNGIGLDVGDFVGPTRRSPGTALAMPRASRSSSRGSSSAETATISLPHRLVRDAGLFAVLYISRAPSTHSQALSDPGW